MTWAAGSLYHFTWRQPRCRYPDFAAGHSWYDVLVNGDRGDDRQEGNKTRTDVLYNETKPLCFPGRGGGIVVDDLAKICILLVPSSGLC